MHFPSSQSVLCWLSLKHFIKRSQLKIQHSKHLGFIMALSTRCCCCRYSIIQTLFVVLSLILRPHGLQRTRLLCPPTVSRGLLKFTSTESLIVTISSSAAPFSCCLQSFPAAESFPMSWLLASGGQMSFQWIFRVDLFSIHTVLIF